MAKKPYIQEQVQTKVAARIRELRLQAGFTNYETFANTYNIDRKQYWRMENGCNLTLRSIVTIANCHKISLAEFFKEI